jgi:hypothetical protein
MEEFRRQLDMLFDQSKDELKEVRPHVVVHCSPRRSLCVMPSCRPRADLVPTSCRLQDLREIARMAFTMRCQVGENVPASTASAASGRGTPSAAS